MSKFRFSACIFYVFIFSLIKFLIVTSKNKSYVPNALRSNSKIWFQTVQLALLLLHLKYVQQIQIIAEILYLIDIFSIVSQAIILSHKLFHLQFNQQSVGLIIKPTMISFSIIELIQKEEELLAHIWFVNNQPFLLLCMCQSGCGHSALSHQHS